MRPVELNSKIPPKQLEKIGFRIGAGGAHTSRTIMLSELTQVMSAVGRDVARQDYATAIIEQNCLGK